MLDKFLSYINQENLFSLDDKLLLAVSSGIDSMVMTDLIKSAKYKFGIAHINHHLRDKESDAEEQFLRDYSKAHAINCYVHHINPEDFATGNMHAIARKERYDFLYKTMVAKGYDYVLTAHHQGDSIETFFIHLIRGAGLTGLTGIKTSVNNVRRPLMIFTRKEIENYALLNGVQFMEDSSNHSDKYLRNKIRHHLIPAFRDISLDADKSIQKSITNLHREQLLLNELTAKMMERFIIHLPKYIAIDLTFLNTFAQSETLLFKMIAQYGFSVETVHSIINDGSQGSKFLSRTHEGLIDRKKLLIRTFQAEEDVLLTIDIDSLPYTLAYKGENYFFELIKIEKIDFSMPSVLYLDCNDQNGILIVRNWQEGDKFSPFGMKGKTKKVKDYLIDKKINQWQKDETLVLASQDKIIAIMGLAIADEVKIGTMSTSSYVLKISKTSL